MPLSRSPSRASARYRVLQAGCLVLGVLALAACGGGGAGREDRGGARGEGGYYKVGKPYQIKGNWYYPTEDYSYDETGIASWYGDDFHRLKTANGETYNKNELTAAHKTLPMPSLARVTNLENGRSIVVRVNDRGPFSGARIIDVSQRAAQLLGFERQGTAKVRVQVLADESKAIADAMRTYGSGAQETVKTTEQAMTSARTAAANPPSVEVMPLGRGAAPSAAPVTMANVRPVAEYVQLPMTGDHKIFVQAGAFTSVDNARKLQQSLQKIGPVTLAQALVKGVQYYRVRLGPADSVAAADKLLARVSKAGVSGARIVVD